MQTTKYLFLNVFCFSLMVQAEPFDTVVLSASLSDESRVIDGFKFKEPPYITVWNGQIKRTGGFGYYIQTALPMVSNEWRYTYTLLNGGEVYPLNRSISVYAGAGASFEDVRYATDYGYVLKTTKNKDHFNLNGGVIFMVDDVELNIGYNSASESVDFGVVISF